MSTEKSFAKLVSLFDKYPEVKLVYLFGSQAKEEAGPISDYDFAIYLDTQDKKEAFNIKLELLNQLNQILKTDEIDLVVLNITESPELKYNIIKEGKLIFEREPFRVLVEPRILNEYFDFHLMLSKYGLTRA